MDLCGHNITDFMQTYDQINMIQYQRNSSIISFLYEQLKNNGTLTLKAIIDNAQLLKELQNYFFGVFGAGAINPKIYDEKRIRELLNNYENILEKDRPFALRKFITENVIVDKKPIFHGKKQDDDININRIIELLHIIIDKKVYYLENYAKINTFKSEIIDVEKYVALYD
jgi:hypothetical protein